MSAADSASKRPPPPAAPDSASVSASGGPGALRVLAGQSLFESVAPLMRTLEGIDADALNARASVLPERPYIAATGRPIRFVVPDADPMAYEQRVHERGEVPTRPDNWHDLFNALVWMRFPRAKAALNAVHIEEMGPRGGSAPRGARRDAATQFDESGLVVLSADPALLSLLASHRWTELFWQQRQSVCRHMRFLVFGHGLLDALRRPFHGLCGRAVLIETDAALADAGIDAQASHADAVIAERFLRGDCYPRARCFTPVPVLGIPGVTPGNACRDYYEDTRQFRPPRGA